MVLYQAVILALVQALTEFLPISSTAHLILFPWLLGWPEPGLAFDVALHTGTLVAVFLYFLPTWLELGLAGIGFHYPRDASHTRVGMNRRLFWYLVLGTFPAGVAGWLFHHQIEDALRKPIPIGVMLIGVGLLMWLAEARARLERTLENIGLKDALVIGAAQSAALVPGVSRSGVTIATGMLGGLTREAAARFSFLLSTPVIAGAAIKEVPKLIVLGRAGGPELPLSTLLISIAVAAVVGYLVIAVFLRYLQTRTLKIFIYYRILFGIVVLLLAFLQGATAR